MCAETGVKFLHRLGKWEWVCDWEITHTHTQTHTDTYSPGEATVVGLLANMAVATRLHWLLWSSQRRQTVLQSFNNWIKVKLHSVDSLWLITGIYGSCVALGQTEHFTDQEKQCTDGCNLSVSFREYLISKHWNGKSLGLARLRSLCHSQCGGKTLTFPL